VSCVVTAQRTFSENAWGILLNYRRMRFRFKAFGLHLSGSACVLALVLGALYLGWYRWPGWYLTGGFKIAALMTGIDVILGPLLTLVVANPGKPRRELARDIGIIVGVQILAAGYGASTLWQGRVLYYTFSQKYLEIVQAVDLQDEQIALGRKLKPGLAPHWYSLPRWVYAPLPQDPKLQQEIMGSAISGDDDVIQMPQYYQPWEAAFPELRKTLRMPDEVGQFSRKQRQTLKIRMSQRGLPVDQANAVAMMGKETWLLAVFEPKSMTLQALIEPD
jgi:hypothetical protein